jgi:hypothetical protein
MDKEKKGIKSPYTKKTTEVIVVNKNINANGMCFEETIRAAAKEFAKLKEKYEHKPTTYELIAFLSGISTGITFLNRGDEAEEELQEMPKIAMKIAEEYEKTGEITIN